MLIDKFVSCQKLPELVSDTESENEEDYTTSSKLKRTISKTQKIPVKMENLKQEGENLNKKPKEGENLLKKPKEAKTIIDLSHREVENIGRVFMTRLESNVDPERDSMIVDSGGTSNMFFTEKPFKNISEKPIGVIRMANNETIPTLAKEDIMIDLRDGNLRCKGVLHAPDLRKNILSVAKLTDEGYEFLFDRTKVEILDTLTGNVITGIRKDNLYHLFPGNIDEVLNHVTTDDQVDLKPRYDWEVVPDDSYAVNFERSSKVYKTTRNEKRNINEIHRELGHVSFPYIRKMINAKIITGITLDEKFLEEHCHTCKITKSVADTHPIGRDRATQKGERIHSDVCGPLRVQSRGGYKYFVTFIDEYSMNCVIRLMKTKSEVAEHFIEFVKMFENTNDCKVKYFRHDRGTEYINQTIKEFCMNKGIVQQPTDGYNPKQNAIAERRNYTLLSGARAMLTTGKLPPMMWGDAILTKNYLLNRTASKKNPGWKSPVEMLSGRKPDLSRLSTFGAIAYAHVPKEMRGKLDNSAITTRFIGYSSEAQQERSGGSSGYMLYDIKTKKVLTTANVVFNTSMLYNLPETSELCIEDDETPDSEDFTKNDLKESHDIDVEQDLEKEVTEEHVEQKRVTVEGKGGVKQRLIPFKSLIIPKHKRLGRPEGKEFTALAEYMIQRYEEKEQAKDDRRNMAESFIAFEEEDGKTSEPMNIKEAMQMPDWPKWKEAIDKEMQSIKKDTVTKMKRKDIPPGRKAIGCKWVLKVKRGSEGEILKYKARLVAKGFAQKPGVDFTHTFAPTVKMSAIRVILTMAGVNDLEVRHLDIKTAYLHGDLDEDIYMEMPEWYDDSEDTSEYVYKLNRGIYGLKQAGRQWNKKLDQSLRDAGFIRCEQEPCVYYKVYDGKLIVLGIFVDDIVAAARSNQDIEEVKKFLSLFYEINDEGELEFYTGIKVQRDRSKGVFYLSQPQYIRDMLRRFNMENAKYCKIPLEINLDQNRMKREPGEFIKKVEYREAVGSLMFLMIATRPELAYSVSVVSRYLDSYSNFAWEMVKRIFRYISGTKDFGIVLGASEGENLMKLECFVDADWAGDISDRKSTSGYVCLLNNSVISWKSEKQAVVAQSTTEAELISANSGAREVISLQRILNDIGLTQTSATKVWEDNQGCIALMHNDVKNKRTKHIEIKWFWIRDQVQSGLIEMQYCPTGDMLADIMTKQLSVPKFEELRLRLRIVDISLLE